MKQYKGYYIDGVIFSSEADIDEHIKAAMIRSYKVACEMFSRHSDMEHSIYASEIAVRLHALGLTWDEIEQIEIEAYKAA